MSCCAGSVSQKMCCAWCILKFSYSFFFIAAGADKFLNLVAPWQQYISPRVLQNIPLDAAQLMMLVGCIELLIGALILAPKLKLTHIGAHLATLWFFVVIGNLVSMGFPYDVAVRDLVLAMGALALAFLTKAKEEKALIAPPKGR